MAARRGPREEREDGRDAIVVGAGLAGLVAACEIADGGRSVLLLEREGEQDLGAQAWWSFGGLFLVDSPDRKSTRLNSSHVAISYAVFRLKKKRQTCGSVGRP